jgi:hypothetical protein
MTADDLRAIIADLEARVSLTCEAPPTIAFAEPTEAEMLEAGLHPDGVRQLLNAPWYPEMVEEIVETPDFCEPGDSPGQVLRYAQDVVVEYIRKRFKLD